MPRSGLGFRDTKMNKPYTHSLVGGDKYKEILGGALAEKYCIQRGKREKGQERKGLQRK